MDDRRENLAKLADFLERLPADYEHFDMRDYVIAPVEPKSTGLRQIMHGECGTTACALGHGPAAGIIPTGVELKPDGHIHWVNYAHRFVERSHDDDWYELFGSHWADKPGGNTPAAAAARIREYLARG